MKRILIITYYWPPSGGSAVQRWLTFANLLAETNEVHVLTVDEAFATYQLRDESLIRDIHPEIEVHTTKTREPFKLFTFFFGKSSIPKPAFSNETNPSVIKKISRFIRGNAFIPDPRKGWKSFAVKKAESLISQKKFDCLITAGPPHSTHFIGEALRQKYQIFWIADFHDLWTDVIYYDMLYHLPLVKHIDAKLERRILEGADVVVTVGEKYKAKLLSKSPKLQPEKIKILRIGYNEKLFDSKTVQNQQEYFTITYTGTIADFYEPAVFIAALKKTVEVFPEVPFCLCFAGVLSDNIRQLILEAGLGAILQDKGYLSHKEAVNLLQATTILLLVNPVTKDEEMVIPGKIYEYLAAGKPIINITLKTAETASIIRECGAGETFDRNDPTPIISYLHSLVSRWKTTKNLDLHNYEMITPYSRKAIAVQLQQIIDRS